jgi:2-desacetyl-2-hydroxyethyl bacteriochlorophyllide A dehydrogenase
MKNESREMSELVAYGDGKVRLRMAEKPNKSAEDILIRPLVSGICGTDLDIISGDIDPSFISYPVVLGHEWSGEVIETSFLREDIEVGDHVVVQGIIPCNKCVQCIAGHTNRCLTYDEFGFTRDGGCGSYVCAPAWLVHKISKKIEPEISALIEPMSVVATGLMKAQIKHGQSILVIGDGSIGLIAAVLSQNWTPERLDLVGLRADQRGLAALSGVDDFMLTGTESLQKYDLVIEASGSIDGVIRGFNSLIRGGTLLLLGFPGTGKTIPLSIDELVNGDFSILGSFGYTTKAWEKSVELVNSRTLNLDHLVTHRFPLTHWEQAIATLGSFVGPRGKVMIKLD